MAGDITIGSLREEEIVDLEQMNRSWPYGRPLQLHVERFQMQEAGEAVYLFAWDGQIPVGHVMLRWHRSAREPRASRPEDAAHIVDLFVIPDYWSQGIGTRLMDVAETLAAQHGCKQIGLSVATDNSRALALYERRGYGDSGSGERTVRWTYTDPEGEEGVREDTLIYMLKALASG